MVLTRLQSPVPLAIIFNSLRNLMTSETIYFHDDFIENKYKNLYFKIIMNAKNRPEISGYKEKHHIIPRSMGGSDSLDNLVYLTSREHFICHYLLIKFSLAGSRKLLIYAFRMMGNKSETNKERYINSRLYAASKKDFSKLMSQLHKGKPKTQEHRAKISAKLSGVPYTEERKASHVAGMSGKKHKDLTKNKMSMSLLGRPKSEQHKINMSGKTVFTNIITHVCTKFDLSKISINEILSQGWVKGHKKTVLRNFLEPSTLSQ